MLNERLKGIKAVPLFMIVRQWAFINDLPFTLYKDQRAAITLYMQSLTK